MTHEDLYQRRLSEYTWAPMTYQDIAKRSVELEELVIDLWAYVTEPVTKRNSLRERIARHDELADRMKELGVEP